MEALILRVDAPMMSFGGVVVDQHGFTDRFPGQAMLTGLFANALGLSHGDSRELEGLQSRVKYAARWDVAPQPLLDYQTVDLGQDSMKEAGWTTRGKPEQRGKGEATAGTSQRFRHYWADGLMTIAVALDSDDWPSLEHLGQALRHPKRPLFLGRKSCVPARPLLDPTTPLVSGPNLLDILRSVGAWDRAGRRRVHSGQLEACWPADGTQQSRSGRPVYDLRDWRNQLMAGSRWRSEGLIAVDGQQ
jgi:CRISPR system Cascade subunit CasD